MADEWMLVPTREGCVLVNDTDALGDDVLNWYRLRSVPPIPRPVWDAMVERGARALCRDPDEVVTGWRWVRRGGKHARVELAWPAWQDRTADADAALRAALNNPRVEGDEG